jgi:hypothetical protein
MSKQQKNETKKKPRYTTLIALLGLVLVALFALPMRAAGTVGYMNVSAAGNPLCVNLPTVVPTATSNNPRLCTPTPAVTPTSAATLTATPTNTATPTSTATATNTATPTSTPTATSTPTDTATPAVTPTNTATPTSTPTAVPPASITVYNTAAFFVQYYVSYNLPGLPLQSLYSGVFNVNQGVTLTIPGEATNVGVLVQHYTGITGWQTTCTRAYAQATSVVIIVSGTTFSPICTGG